MRTRTRLLLAAILLGSLWLVPFTIMRSQANQRAGDGITGTLLWSQHATQPPLLGLVTVPPSTWYLVGPGQPVYPQLTGGNVLLGRLDLWLDVGKEPKDRPSAAPVQADGMVVVGMRKGSVVAVDGHTHILVWTSDPMAASISHVVRHDGRVYAAGGSTVRALDGRSGKTLWSCDLPAPIAGAAVDGDVLVAAANDAKLYVIDLSTGKLRSSASLPAAPAGDLTLHDGTAFLWTVMCPGLDDHGLVAVDLSSGSVRWRYVPDRDVRYSEGGQSAAPLVLDDAVYFTTMSRLVALDRANGKPRWQRTVDPAEYVWRTIKLRMSCSDRAFGAPACHRGLVYLCTPTSVFGYDQQGRQTFYCGYERAKIADPYQRVDASPCATPVVRGTVILCQPADASVFAIGLTPGGGGAFPTPSAKTITRTAWIPAASITGITLILALTFRLFKAFIALISLTLAALLTATWLRSPTHADFLGWRDYTPSGKYLAERSTGVTSRNGSLTFARSQHIWETSIPRPTANVIPGRPAWITTPLDPGPVSFEEPPGDVEMLNFARTARSRSSGTPLGNQEEHSLTLPHWPVISLLAIAPLAWITGLWRDRKRHPKGHCPNCGYDLRASPEKCPECGATPPPPRIPVTIPRGTLTKGADS